MKKALFLFSVVLAVIMSLSITAYAAEAGAPFVGENADKISRTMCDVDNNGAVAAADARIILRYSVSLDTMSAADILFADADSDGAVRASDARLALRISVGLENESVEEFSIVSAVEPACADKGRIVAVKSDGTTVEMSINEKGHVLEPRAQCEGKGVCQVCNETVTCPVNHKFTIPSSCDTSVICTVCNEAKPVTPKHMMINGKCSSCGYLDTDAVYSFMYDFVHENGFYEEPDYCVIEKYSDVTFGLLYDEELEVLYIYCLLYGYDEYGNLLAASNFYLDIMPSLEDYRLELWHFFEDNYCTSNYTIDHTQLNTEVPGALTETFFEAPGFDVSPAARADIALTSEAVAVEMLLWFDEFAAKNGFGFTSYDLGFRNLT